MKFLFKTVLALLFLYVQFEVSAHVHFEEKVQECEVCCLNLTHIDDFEVVSEVDKRDLHYIAFNQSVYSLSLDQLYIGFCKYGRAPPVV